MRVLQNVQKSRKWKFKQKLILSKKDGSVFKKKRNNLKMQIVW